MCGKIIDPKEWGDLFAGGGGTTTGALMVKDALVSWAINHDLISIKTHAINHPETVHYTEDITIFDERQLKRVFGIWASLECTNFSRAKGGLSRDPDSRTLADHMPRYVVWCDPTYIVIENVMEFLKWGPLDKDNRPIKEREGEDYERWIQTMCDLGYHYDYKIINCADVGCQTIRKRYIGIFAKHGYPIAFPEQTHSKGGKDGFKKWIACKGSIELEDMGRSIFDRKKPYVPKTLRRFAGGIHRHSDEINFIVSCYNTLNTSSISNPCPAILTRDKHQLVSFLTDHTWLDYQDKIDQPMRTQTTRQTKQLVHLLSKHFGNGDQIHDSSIEKPYPTIMTTRRTSMVSVQHSSNGRPERNTTPINSPLTAIASQLKHQLLTAQYNSGGSPETQNSSLNEPLRSITGSNKHSLLTLIAKSGDRHFTEERKAFASLIIEVANGPRNAISLEAVYVLCAIIDDVLARFLKPRELARITGFPEGYFTLGNVRDKVKMIGNAVPPLLAKKVIGTLHNIQLEVTNAA